MPAKIQVLICILTGICLRQNISCGIQSDWECEDNGIHDVICGVPYVVLKHSEWHEIPEVGFKL
jgi:hypothetical protein